MRTICLLIRIKFLKHTQKMPGKFRICVSQEQVNARDTLFELYLKKAGRSELYPALHTLLVSILCHQTTQGKLACPTDYSMCLACLEDKKDTTAWNFKIPSLITGQFSRLQYCLRMVFFTHSFSIAHGGPNYQTPLLSLPLATNILPTTAPLQLSTIPPNSDSIPPEDEEREKNEVNSDSILQELKSRENNEDDSEVIDSVESQLPGYDEGVLDSDLMEDDIEVVDDEKDKNLLQ